MKRTEVLDAVQAALTVGGLTAPVLVNRAEWPADADQVVVIDVVSSRPFGYDQDYSHQVQVAAYAPTVLEAEALSDQSIEALKIAGFLPGTSRPAPVDDGSLDGVITEWRLP